MISIHRYILPRVAIAWLLLSLLVGGVVFWVEIERIDEKAAALALNEAHRFPAELLQQKKLAEIQAHMENLTRQHFGIVEVYDANRVMVAERIAPGQEMLEESLKQFAHGFPEKDSITYHRLRIDDRWVLQVLVPLRDQADKLSGFLEGVYIVDRETEAGIYADIGYTVAFVLLAVLATSLVLYPLAVALNRDVVRQSKQILRGNLEMMAVLGSAIAKRDSDTHSHNYRVTLYAVALAEAIRLDAEKIRQLISGAFLHDVGKIGIPDGILLKPGRLDDDEFRVMKTHVELGEDIIRNSGFLSSARDVVACHHEKFDGGGYPRGLAGKAIPVVARVFAVADVFDALTSKRPYKPAMPLDDALNILHDGAGQHFDPTIIQAFEDIVLEQYTMLHAAEEEWLRGRLEKVLGTYYGI
ncbi:MAG: HD-GYP domain-containing protein [Betaproteobacteria bacterium]|nr:HD-GYP domain-containing protein [Betaproteobacteria bacterium]